MDITFSIFPKFFCHLSMSELAALVKCIGLDTSNLVVRKGYWCEQDNLKDDVSAFIKTFDQSGIKVHFATTDFTVQSLIADDTPLRILSDNGISDFRMEYFRQRLGENIHVAIERIRNEMEFMAELCSKNNLKMHCQLHHGLLISSPSMAWVIVKDLPPENLGVMLDPGNQAHEGYDAWYKSIPLLQPYISAIGIKDVNVYRNSDSCKQNDKGWVKDWAPVYEGITNWHQVIGELKKNSFNGTFVFMPFYNHGAQNEMVKKLGREIQYLKKIINTIDA